MPFYYKRRIRRDKEKVLTGEGTMSQSEVTENGLNDGNEIAISGSGRFIRKHTTNVMDDRVIVQEAWYEVLYAKRRRI